MPLYFFSILDGRSGPNPEGTELTSDDAARIAAIRMAGALLRDAAHQVMHGDAWNLSVRDEAERLVCCVEIRVSGPGPGG